MTQDVQDAVAILCKAYADVCRAGSELDDDYFTAHKVLNNAIRHLAYPDRDTYPKTRKGTKGAPIVRR